MRFFPKRCTPSRSQRAKAHKEKHQQQSLNELNGSIPHLGYSSRLLVVDKAVDHDGVLPEVALGHVHVVTYDSQDPTSTFNGLIALIQEAHNQNNGPFLSIAIANHGADATNQWRWTADKAVNLNKVADAIDALAPLMATLAGALAKTTKGYAHIDLLACSLATSCKGLVPALERLYGIDFRASTDTTGQQRKGGDWKMETDNNYDVAQDYFDKAQLRARYEETMPASKKFDLDFSNDFDDEPATNNTATNSTTTTTTLPPAHYALARLSNNTSTATLDPVRIPASLQKLQLKYPNLYNYAYEKVTNELATAKEQEHVKGGAALPVLRRASVLEGEVPNVWRKIEACIQDVLSCKHKSNSNMSDNLWIMLHGRYNKLYFWAYHEIVREDDERPDQSNVVHGSKSFWSRVEKLMEEVVKGNKAWPKGV